jgi:hypothetical protein
MEFIELSPGNERNAETIRQKTDSPICPIR